MGFAVDADLAFGHRLQQGRLGLGRRPVDLVGHQQVGENRARTELEAARLHVVDRRAEQIGRQQIGRELHPREAQPQRRGERPRDQCLAHAGQIFDQHVTARQHGGQDQRERGALPDHHAFDLVEHRLAVGRRGRGRHRHRRSIRRRISSRVADPGPGSRLPVREMLLGSTQRHSSSPKTMRPVAFNAVGSLAAGSPGCELRRASFGRRCRSQSARVESAHRIVDSVRDLPALQRFRRRRR